VGEVNFYASKNHIFLKKRIKEKFMAAKKKIKAVVKIQIPAAKATAGPPIGSSLGPHGINIGQFVKDFNAKTAGEEGMVIPVVMTIYEDRSFEFILKTPPVAVLIMKEIGLSKGSGVPNKTKVGKLTMAQVEKIAKIKMPDLNATSLEAAMSMVKGTARSMGVTVEG
jgi:large subunit ribosomal protein L11